MGANICLIHFIKRFFEMSATAKALIN